MDASPFQTLKINYNEKQNAFFDSSSFVCAFTTKMSAQSWTTGNNLIYINPSTTNVGIGTSQPIELLHVNNGA